MPPTKPRAETKMSPLISSLLEVSSGEGSLLNATLQLEAYEQTHGIHIYDDHDARVAPGTFKPHMPISAERVRTLARSWEQFDRALEPLGRAEERQLIIQRLGPFIANSGLWVSGADLAEDHLIIFTDGEVGSWTAEQWNEHLANYAAVIQYAGRDDWNAAKLVTHIEASDAYRKWVNALRLVLKQRIDEER